MTTVFRDVGAYRIIREIGHGGMATVFLAEDTRHEREVALKLVSMASDREGREVLEAERWGTKLQARLAETCGLVPRVFEEGDQPPYYFIAMEYVRGENLSELIARGPIPTADAVHIASQLAVFLDTAHRFNTTIDGREFWSLVHGDLKPRNVRIADTGEVKILDFGIAKALSLSRKVTRNDFGSMPYLSPERLDSTHVDASADLWALGVILYELLSGAAPFHAADTRRLEQQIRAGYMHRPLSESCPLGVRAIAARMLAPQAADRYETAALLLEDLKRFESGATPAAVTAGFPARLDEATRRTRPDATEDPERTRRTIVPGGSASTGPGTAAQPAGSPVAKPEAPPSVVPRRGIRSHPIRTVLMLAALFLACNEIAIGFKANRVAAVVATRDLETLDEMWTEYDGLSRRSYLRVGVAGLEQALPARVDVLTRDVIANYRSTVPTVRERQWQIAQRNLQRALVLSPGNRTLRSALRYCEGHLHRINGEAEKARRRTAAARQEFTEAVSAFREAAELRRDWPDPFLGLARVFIYGLDDIDRAADALKQAQRLGYSTGDRENAQLADGYRARGDSLWQTARQLAEMPQEAEYLQRAIDAYKQAQELYERTPAFPGVPANLRRVHRALEQIDARIAERDLEKAAAVLTEDPWR